MAGKRVQRFGRMNRISDSSDTSDSFADNSLDDPPYQPPSKRSKNDFGEESDDSSNTSIESKQGTESEVLIENFDCEFDSIKSLSIAAADANVHMSTSINRTEISQSELMFIRESLEILMKNSNQILVRLQVLEKSAIKSGSLITLKDEDHGVDPFREYNAFVSSQKLPMDDFEKVKTFEKELESEKFRKEAVSKTV